MSRYLLDTNIISAMLRDPGSMPARRFRTAHPGSICTSIIVAAELRFGVIKKGSVHLARGVELILAAVPVLPFEHPADVAYGDIRADLERAGLSIGPNDLLIAAQVRALGLTLVTDNEREFGRVPGLAIENWLR